MLTKSSAARYLLFFTLVFISTLSIRLAHTAVGESVDSFGNGSADSDSIAAGERSGRSTLQASSDRPSYADITLTSISGEIYLNPEYTGRIVSVNPLGPVTYGSVKNKIDFSQTLDLWPVLTVPKSMSGLQGLNVTGEKGTVRISRSGAEMAVGANNDGLKIIKKPKVGFGHLSSTILFAETEVSHPGKFEIGVFDLKDSRFIRGDIIALTRNQLAAKFENLPSTVISSEGKLRYSLREDDGSFINSEVDAWGYELIIPDAEIATSIPIRARIYGLTDEKKVKFRFHPLEGQQFSVPVITLSVKEINSGETITEISTSLTGSQLVSVNVEESIE